MSKTKTCSECDEQKPLDEFYAHSGNPDGYTYKCKACMRQNHREWYQEKKHDDEYMDRERQWSRDNYHSMSDEEKRAKRRDPDPKKRRAYDFVQRHVTPPEGKECHHWSYQPEHRGSVFFLTESNHGKLHRFMEYDDEAMMYRREDSGQLLDSKKKHAAFIREVLDLDPETAEVNT